MRLPSCQRNRKNISQKLQTYMQAKTSRSGSWRKNNTVQCSLKEKKKETRRNNDSPSGSNERGRRFKRSWKSKAQFSKLFSYLIITRKNGGRSAIRNVKGWNSCVFFALFRDLCWTFFHLLCRRFTDDNDNRVLRKLPNGFTRAFPDRIILLLIQSPVVSHRHPSSNPSFLLINTIKTYRLK